MVLSDDAALVRCAFVGPSLALSQPSTQHEPFEETTKTNNYSERIELQRKIVEHLRKFVVKYHNEVRQDENGPMSGGVAASPDIIVSSRDSTESD